MKTKALAIATTAIILFTSCEEKLPQQKEMLPEQITNQPPPQEKTTSLYVIAASGLSLREYNNLNSQKLAVMPYVERSRRDAQYVFQVHATVTQMVIEW